MTENPGKIKNINNDRFHINTRDQSNELCERELCERDGSDPSRKYIYIPVILMRSLITF